MSARPVDPSGSRAATPAARFPERLCFVGDAALLEPLGDAHVDALWQAAQGAEASWHYLRYGPFASRDALQAQVRELAGRAHQPFWAVCPRPGMAAQGWLSLCDIYPEDSAIEIGSIWFSPALQRSRAATEAVFLLLRYAFDGLGYQRMVWRCMADNQPSAGAARRYGFRPEGVWRSAVNVKGRRGDVAWHSLLADEWPARRAAMQAWLAPGNFDAQGRPLSRLARD
ncbi:GNAT family N-acetyltransferase [Bordetella petrii]|uniref:GNAT family N-acetyltransferase n=1 Tax=Bordetella petrii TaxID=94624 RepID=UPI001A95B3C3|nr:GNAT family N-acetyltransferase [Bordetella petrii]